MNLLFPAETKDSDSRRVAREIDRERRRAGNERTAINNELAKLDAAAKALAKAGRREELTIVAGQIASLRRQRTELTRVDSQQQRIKNVIQANARRDRNMDALRRGTAHLEASSASCPPKVANKIALDYQKAIAKSEYNAQLLEDVLEGDDEEDGDELDNGASIAEEYMAAAGIQLANTMPTLPKHATAPPQREPAARAAYAAQETASPLSSSSHGSPPSAGETPPQPPVSSVDSDEAPASSADDIEVLEARLRNIKRNP